MKTPMEVADAICKTQGLTFALATSAGKEGDLRQARGFLAAAIARAILDERERCASIALAINSKRGNEAEIARAIREGAV